MSLGQRSAPARRGDSPLESQLSGRRLREKPPAQQGIEEIVVTAQKRSEFAQEVPTSLTALGAQKLAFRGVENLRDLQLQIPGLYYGTDSGAGQQIAIRGVGLAIAIPVIEAPIATYVDGVYQVR